MIKNLIIKIKQNIKNAYSSIKNYFLKSIKKVRSNKNKTLHVVFILALLAFVHSYLSNKISLFIAFMLFIVGMFIWSIYEYFIHNFLYHKMPENYVNRPHKKHHLDINNPEYYHTGFLQTVILLAPVILVFYALIPWYYSGFVTSGFLIGFVLYDIIHYFIHMYHKSPENFEFIKNNTLFKKLYKHHITHHEIKNNSNFSITTTIWDILFKTKSVYFGVKNVK